MQMDIARDLHDTVGQNISYLRLKLDHIVERNLVADPNVAQDIKNMSEVANESYDMMRGTLAALQAEDAADLSHLFARYASQIEERSKFMIEFANHGQPRMVSAIQMRQLFYVFREILSNIEKHADASQVSIDMTWDEEYITLVVFDNGRGFDSTDPHSGHYGLRFIQDRLASLNGTISIYSAIGSGSEIIIQVPCEQ
jgi:two-component system nitrate/nitrite sensor histidine kinase NarX